jgi:prepilin-type N-terminal cleavage/methylation domain-containing protein
MKRGFTLIEIVIVLAVIAVLAAFITPMIAGYVERSRLLRATNDCKTIAEAIINFNKDTRAFPVYSATPLNKTNATLSVLYTGGAEATASGGSGTGTWLTGNRDLLQNHLEKGLTSGGQPYPTTLPFAWKGPYLTDFYSDPWGTRYYINVAYLQPGAGNNAVWVLSAGPTQLIETNFAQPVSGATTPSLGGDDIGYRIK